MLLLHLFGGVALLRCLEQALRLDVPVLGVGVIAALVLALGKFVPRDP